MSVFNILKTLTRLVHSALFSCFHNPSNLWSRDHSCGDSNRRPLPGDESAINTIAARTPIHVNPFEQPVHIFFFTLSVSQSCLSNLVNIHLTGLATPVHSHLLYKLDLFVSNAVLVEAMFLIPFKPRVDCHPQT